MHATHGKRAEDSASRVGAPLQEIQAPEDVNDTVIMLVKAECLFLSGTTIASTHLTTCLTTDAPLHLGGYARARVPGESTAEVAILPVPVPALAEVPDYNLKCGRVPDAPSGDRNSNPHLPLPRCWHDTRGAHTHLWLADKAVYRYLSTHGARPALGVRDEDAAWFDQLKLMLKHVGRWKVHVAQRCQLLAAILHLVNLDFVLDRARNGEAAVVYNGNVLDIAAEFLGVRIAALEPVLSYRKKMVKK
jgi:hypothetical protein